MTDKKQIDYYTEYAKIQKKLEGWAGRPGTPAAVFLYDARTTKETKVDPAGVCCGKPGKLLLLLAPVIVTIAAKAGLSIRTLNRMLRALAKANQRLCNLKGKRNDSSD